MVDTEKPKFIWLFDENSRVYKRDEKGRVVGGPIWIEKWRKYEVTGETRVSWILSSGLKVSKKQKHGGVAFSEHEIQKKHYVHKNAWNISQLVRNECDYEMLKAVADLIGYEESNYHHD